MTYQEDDVRLLREQLARFVIEQVKLSQAEGALAEPLADLRRQLDADVRTSVADALAQAGFDKGAVRLDEASVSAVAAQLFQLCEAQRRDAEARAQAPGQERAQAQAEDWAPDQSLAAATGPDASAPPLAEPVDHTRGQKSGLARSWRRIRRHRHFPLLMVVLGALALVGLLFVFLPRGDGTSLGGAAQIDETQASPLPVNPSPESEPAAAEPGAGGIQPQPATPGGTRRISDPLPPEG